MDDFKLKKFPVVTIRERTVKGENYVDFWLGKRIKPFGFPRKMLTVMDATKEDVKIERIGEDTKVIRCRNMLIYLHKVAYPKVSIIV